MTFDEFLEQKIKEANDYTGPLFIEGQMNAAHAAGKLEAAQHILDMWKEQMAHETSFRTRLLAYVEELK